MTGTPTPSPRDIFQWEVRSWSRALSVWSGYLPSRRPALALGIGEREGGLSLWLAAQGFEVTCTDLHPFPAGTRELHARHGLQDRIRYLQADATALAFPDASFDVVCFKSVIGALATKERQALAIREMHRVLKPGGVLLFAENLHGSPLHVQLRKRFVAWDHYWRYLDPLGDRDLFAPFEKIEDRTTGLLANLGRTEWQRDLLARFDALASRLVPVRWRTIWYGVAVKADR